MQSIKKQKIHESVILSLEVHASHINAQILGGYNGIRNGIKFALVINNIHYFCIVIKSEKTIHPNEKGTITVAMLTRDILTTSMVVGSEIKLMHGVIQLGIGNVLSIKKADITTDGQPDTNLKIEYLS